MKSFFLTAFILIVLAFPGVTYAAEQNPCLTCHADMNKPSASVHAALSSGCQACHIPVEGKQHPAQKDSMTLTEKIPGLCYNCHDRSQFKGKSIHPAVVIDTCTACHKPHRSNFKKLLVKALPGLCFECHTESKFKDKIVHKPVGEGLCMSCHKPHASNFRAMLINEPPELCYPCHDKKMFTKKYVHVVAAIPNGCTLCHKSHAGSTKNLLLQPVFELCTRCHVTQKNGMHITGQANLGYGESMHPVKGVQDPSNPSQDLTCTSCHNPHSSDYRKLYVARNLCEKCHKGFF